MSRGTPDPATLVENLGNVLEMAGDTLRRLADRGVGGQEHGGILYGLAAACDHASRHGYDAVDEWEDPEISLEDGEDDG